MKPLPGPAQPTTPASVLLRELNGTTFIVIDFEALTPAGRPPEPVEVAAIALACRGGQLTEAARCTELMRPPADVPVTSEFTRITAITAGMLSGARPACEVMADLERQLMVPGRCRLVAHSAPTEAGLLAGQRDHCPQLAATPLLDTVRLARAAAPGLPSYRLDSVLRYYGVPRPADRHRALPDTEVTAAIFARILADGASAPGWATLTDLDAAAGRPPASPRAVSSVQETLFLARKAGHESSAASSGDCLTSGPHSEKGRRGMTDLPRHSVSVMGIVFRDDGRVLAIQRDDDLTWVPPGGVLELDESPQDGVAREVLEETGLHVRAERLTGVYKNMKLGVVNLVFRCTLLGGQLHPTDEARQVAWLSMDEAKRKMPEARLIRVTDALTTNDNDTPPVRIHDGIQLI